MAGTYAKFTGIGYLGKDPEMTYQQNGQAMTKFSIANKRKKGDKEVSDWYNITVWGKTAEDCNNFLRKGSYVYVEGRFSNEIWFDNQNNARLSNNVSATEVRFLDRNADANSGNQGNANSGNYNDGGDDFS